MSKRTENPVEHFWARVMKTSGCWLWSGPPNNSGYGSAVHPLSGKVASVHRIAYELTSGPIPQGLIACHRCDVRLCVNPSHIFIGTYKDNAADCKAKGRLSRKGCGKPQNGENNHGAKLTWEVVHQIHKMFAEKVSQREIARRLGVHHANVWAILHQKSWITSEQTQR